VSCVQVFEIVCEAVSIGTASSSQGFLYHQSVIRKSCSACVHSSPLLTEALVVATSVVRNLQKVCCVQLMSVTRHFLTLRLVTCCMSYIERRGRAVTTAPDLVAFGFTSRKGMRTVYRGIPQSIYEHTTITSIFRIHWSFVALIIRRHDV